MTAIIRRGLDIDAVREAMTENPECIPAELTIAEACRYIQDSPRQGFPVVGKSGRLTRIITRHELLEARQQRGGDLPVRVAATTNLAVTTPDEPLSLAAVKLGRHDVGRLPVVEPGNPETLTGILTRTDIIEVYSRILRILRLGASLSSSLEEARSNMEVNGA
jgi:CBS domain-containing protein